MKKRFDNSELVADWYEVKPLRDDLFLIDEQDHVAFFVIKVGDRGYFIDSGLGLIDSAAKELLRFLGIQSFDVIATHSHCDHSGLNHLANSIQILEDEWIKYQELDEQNQIKTYIKMIGTDLPWPKELKEFPPKQEPWKPTSFISEGQILKLGSWNLEAILLPGHTRGHLIFLEKQKGVLFLGDFIVSGTNFIHLRDSSIEAYFNSLQKLDSILSSSPEEPMLLSCHDQIPISKNHIQELIAPIEAIKSNNIKPTSRWEANDVFFGSMAIRHGVSTCRHSH